MSVADKASEYDSASPDALECLQAFLDDVALLTDQDRNSDDDDKVQIMTIHKSKGLEFGTVFVVRSEDNGESREEAEEERRVFYVAMTRAKDSLYVSYAQNRVVYGKRTTRRASRYVGEIPSDFSTKTVDRSSSCQNRWRREGWSAEPWDW